MERCFINARVKVVKKELKTMAARDRDCFEGVYRSYHHSYKIKYMKEDAFKFLYMALYITGLVDTNYHDLKESYDIEKEISKHVKSKSYLGYMFRRLRTDKLKKSVCIPTEAPAVRFCGYYYFFKTTLEALIACSKDTSYGTDKGIISYYEGITNYFVRSTK